MGPSVLASSRRESKNILELDLNPITSYVHTVTGFSVKIMTSLRPLEKKQESVFLLLTMNTLVRDLHSVNTFEH